MSDHLLYPWHHSSCGSERVRVELGLGHGRKGLEMELWLS